MKHLSRDQQQKLNDDARLLRKWKAWHREQREEALAGPHGAQVSELMILLDRLKLNSAAVLLDFMRRNDWSAVDYNTRFTILHEINQAIERLRERNGMVAIDDRLSGQDNVFRRIKQMLFAAPPGAHPGRIR